VSETRPRHRRSGGFYIPASPVKRLKKQLFFRISVVSPRYCPRRFGVGRFLRALGTSINISRDKENGRRELNM
jgi:hypothetical protein